MTLTLTPTSELEAVNEMLSAIGETPVSSLETETFADAQIALTLLRNISRRVQKQGCHFNTEISFSIAPTVSGEILLPANTLAADEIKPQDNPDRDLVIRGSRLYDRKDQTFNIGETVKLDLVLLLPFEDAPESFRDYVTIRACRVFVDRTLGEAAQHRYTKEDEEEAKRDFTRGEVKSRDANMLANNHSRRILNRKYLYR
jgi:hypothetical protein